MKSQIIMPPPGDFTSADLYTRRRWRTVQYILNEFWLRWKSEYLSNLQSRQKWNSASKNFVVNDVVLVKDDGARNEWSLARIIRTKTSDDGNVRSVILITSKQKEIERPIHKLVSIMESQK